MIVFSFKVGEFVLSSLYSDPLRGKFNLVVILIMSKEILIHPVC